MQASAEKALDEELAQKGDKIDVAQGALVAMTPDGAVRALVGGRNYAESQFNRAVAAKRQPGSAFKPFVYLTALEHGLTPDTVREDKPINVKGWQPENYSHEYFGPVTLTQALALSLNTVSVRLTLEVSADGGGAHRAPARHRLEARAERLDRARHLGSLAARACRRLRAVRQWRLCASSPHVIERITAANGKVLYARSAPQLGRIIDARYVAMMNAMMQETLTIGTAHKAALPGWPAAGKTGTPGFPRRLVHRLHRAPRHRRLARQRRRHADQAGRPAAACRSRSGAASCAARIRACRSQACRATSSGNLFSGLFGGGQLNGPTPPAPDPAGRGQ